MTKRITRQLLTTLTHKGCVSLLARKLNDLSAHKDVELSYEILMCDDIYDGSYITLAIYRNEEESDEVYQKRMMFEKHIKDEQLTKEKAEYERLKAKFEGE